MSIYYAIRVQPGANTNAEKIKGPRTQRVWWVWHPDHKDKVHRGAPRTSKRALVETLSEHLGIKPTKIITYTGCATMAEAVAAVHLTPVKKNI